MKVHLSSAALLHWRSSCGSTVAKLSGATTSPTDTKKITRRKKAIVIIKNLSFHFQIKMSLKCRAVPSQSYCSSPAVKIKNAKKKFFYHVLFKIKVPFYHLDPDPGSVYRTRTQIKQFKWIQINMDPDPQPFCLLIPVPIHQRDVTCNHIAARSTCCLDGQWSDWRHLKGWGSRESLIISIEKHRWLRCEQVVNSSTTEATVLKNRKSLCKKPNSTRAFLTYEHCLS